MSKRFTVKCGHCGGTGELPLPAWAIDTLAELPPEGATPPELAKGHPDIVPSTINNRLAQLERWGLVKRSRVNGRTNRWVATRGGKAAVRHAKAPYEQGRADERAESEMRYRRTLGLPSATKLGTNLEQPPRPPEKAE